MQIPLRAALALTCLVLLMIRSNLRLRCKYATLRVTRSAAAERDELFDMNRNPNRKSKFSPRPEFHPGLNKTPVSTFIH
jgi:hypothetical protein